MKRPELFAVRQAPGRSSKCMERKEPLGESTGIQRISRIKPEVILCLDPKIDILLIPPVSEKLGSSFLRREHIMQLLQRKVEQLKI